MNCSTKKIKTAEPELTQITLKEQESPVGKNPQSEIPDLKAQSTDAAGQIDSLESEVRLDFPEDEPLETENKIFSDLESLEKGALAAQEELEEMRKKPFPVDQSGAEFDASTEVDFNSQANEQPDSSSLSDLDVNKTDLDLDVDVPNPKADEATWQEVATKLDLAGAYVEIGDADGAKELLDEILKKGDSQQVLKAKALLATLT